MHQLQTEKLTTQQAFNLLETGMFKRLYYLQSFDDSCYIYRDGAIYTSGDAYCGELRELLRIWKPLDGRWRV